MFFDFRCSKTFFDSGDEWVVMKLGDFIGTNAKIWQNRSNFGYLLQKRDFLKITQVPIFSSRMKLGSCNFIQVYLYMVSKNPCNRFLIFLYYILQV